MLCFSLYYSFKAYLCLFFVVTWVRSTFNNETANPEPRAGGSLFDLTFLRVRRGWLSCFGQGALASREPFIYGFPASFRWLLDGQIKLASKFRCAKCVGARATNSRKINDLFLFCFPRKAHWRRAGCVNGERSTGTGKRATGDTAVSSSTSTFCPGNGQAALDGGPSTSTACLSVRERHT